VWPCVMLQLCVSRFCAFALLQAHLRPHIHATCHTPHATRHWCHTQHAPLRHWHATCHMPRWLMSLRLHATCCHTLHATSPLIIDKPLRYATCCWCRWLRHDCHMPRPCATCSTCHMPHAATPHAMPYAAMLHATCHMPHATCHMPHAAMYTCHAATLHATRHTPHAMPHAITLHVTCHMTCYMLHVTYKCKLVDVNISYIS
jgi:hypothetical protein